MGAKIAKIEYFLPKKILTNEDLAKEFADFDYKTFEEKVGIKSRHISSENQTAVDLAFEAGKKVLANYPKAKIDFLIFCTQSPDFFLPTSACILQERLGLEKIGAYDFNLGCSGYVYGLAMAKGLIEANVANNILLITAETYSKYIHPKDRSNKCIFGDGASATIIERDEKQHLAEFVLKSDGKGADNLIVKNGAARYAFNPAAEEMVYGTDNITTDNNLYMNGPEIFNFTIETIPSSFDEILVKNALTIDDIDYVVFHQANKFMLDYLRRKIKISKEKFHIDLEQTGNTVSSTIPIALKDALEGGQIKAGNKVLVLGFGVGLSWGGTVISF